MDAEREGETVSESATAAGRALLERRSAFNGGKHASVTLPSEQWNEAILAIEAEARAAALDEARAAVDSLRASNYGWASSLQNAALDAIDALRERSGE